MTSRTSTQMASSEPTPRLPALPEVRDGFVSIGLEVPEVPMIPSGGAAPEDPLTPPVATVARALVGDQVSRVLAREAPVADQRAVPGPPLLMNESPGMLDAQQQNVYRQQQQEFLRQQQAQKVPIRRPALTSEAQLPGTTYSSGLQPQTTAQDMNARIGMTQEMLPGTRTLTQPASPQEAASAAQTAAFPFGTPRATTAAAQTMTAAATTMTRGADVGGLLPPMPTNVTMNEQMDQMAEERYRLMQERYQDQINAFHQQQEREREERRKQESYLTHQRDQLPAEVQTAERLRKEEQSRRQQWETQAADNLARVTQYQQELDRRGEQFAAATQQLRDENARRVEEQRQLLAEQRRAHEEAMAIARQTGEVGADVPVSYTHLTLPTNREV